jgi:UDP-N-acetyl-D-mannosaminuronate dehydrogenase
MTPELAIVGAGYIGLPLARCLAEAGVGVVLVDVDEDRVASISTTYPETTREEVLPVLEQSGLEVDKDFFLAFSPERIEGAELSYHDPHVPELPDHGLSSQDLDGSLANADCVAIVTAHSGIDYERFAERARLVVDFRNTTGRNGSSNGRVWKL